MIKMKVPIKDRTCVVCGAVFSEEEYQAEICPDGLCRGCHNSGFTFEDCYLHHLSFYIVNNFLGKKECEIVDLCPRCKKITKKKIEIWNKEKGHTGMTVKCTECNFTGHWRWAFRD